MTNGYQEGCDVCERHRARGTRPLPPHGNCLYAGRDALGHHPDGHCTASGCY